MGDDGTGRPQSAQETLVDILRALRSHLEAQQRNHVDGLPRASNPAAAAAVRRPTAPVATTPLPPRRSDAGAAMTLPKPMPPTSHTPDTATAALAEIRADIGDCQRCKLCSGRTNIVFGVGNPTPQLMFIGEGPGRDEDLQGEPFVGRAGQLLTQIITNGMKLRREDVYIANIVKCRPPENRNPEPDEVAACRGFLDRQIDAVAPRVIVALGLVATQTLLATKTPISRLRGQWHEYRGIKLMPTLHPAYLLRNPADKRLVWEDIKLVMAELGGP